MRLRCLHLPLRVYVEARLLGLLVLVEQLVRPRWLTALRGRGGNKLLRHVRLSATIHRGLLTAHLLVLDLLLVMRYLVVLLHTARRHLLSETTARRVPLHIRRVHVRSSCIDVVEE